jgi:hypothetical protein
MYTNFTLDEKLQEYIDGGLDTATRTDLEAELQQSKELQARVENLRLAKYAIQHTALHAHVKRIQEQYNMTNTAKVITINKTKSSKKWMAYVAAAAVAILLFFVVHNTLTKSAPTADSLYAATFKQYTISTTRATTTPLHSLFVAKKYKALVTQIATNTSPTVEEQFLAAMSYYELGETEKINTLFQSIAAYNAKNNTILYKDDMEYYTGMSYLKQHKITEALAILTPIANNKKHSYSDVVTPAIIASLQKIK